MEFNIKTKNLLSILKKGIFSPGISTVKVNVGEILTIDGVSIGQDRMIQLKRTPEEDEGTVEEGIWDLGDPREIISKIGRFGATDILNIKTVKNKVQISRKKPKKGYKVPVGIEDQMAIPPVKVTLTEEDKVEITVLSSGKTTPPLNLTVGFSVDALVLKEISKESMFNNQTQIKVENGEILVTGVEGEYDTEGEIICDMFISPTEPVESVYNELSDVFKVLSSDTEIKVYFSQDTMMIIGERNKYLEVLYIVMPVIEEK